MSCKRYYNCDLCGSDIKQGTGIGIFHETMGGMRAVYFSREEAGHHLCTACIKGLETMFADLEKMGKMYEELDRLHD